MDFLPDDCFAPSQRFPVQNAPFSARTRTGLPKHLQTDSAKRAAQSTILNPKRFEFLAALPNFSPTSYHSGVSERKLRN
jgi:hypothetical protein